jgi:septum formation protein
METPTFVLASASLARRHLLETVGIEPVIWPSDFDESQVTFTEPASLVEVLARCKAETVATAIVNDAISNQSLRSSLILGCDSLLVVGGEIYGKPADAGEAIARWQTMRGQVGQLYTGHALMDLRRDKSVVRVGATQVYFARVSDEEIESYVATGEPLKCAGCFAIEGKGGLFIEKIEGCHSNVIGLSLPLLRSMLGELGYSVRDFWR